MASIFSHPYMDFSEHSGLFTISTGPVVMNKAGDKILLHIGESTLKYQFIGGRLDDTLSFRENALERAREVVGENQITLTDDNPTILMDTIIRDNSPEQILLIHYKAYISDEDNIGMAQWFTQGEIESLHHQNMTASPNILIASKHFFSL